MPFPTGRLAGLALIAALLGGCGSILARSQDVHLVDADYFRSTQGDVQLLTSNLDEGSFPMSTVCWMSLICPVATVVSVPVDLVVDVALLPHDIAAER